MPPREDFVWVSQRHGENQKNGATASNTIHFGASNLAAAQGGTASTNSQKYLSMVAYYWEGVMPDSGHVRPDV